MDGPAANDHPVEVDDRHSTIQRVSYPWPTRTKEALSASLGHGILEDIRVTIPSGPGSTEQPIYFARAVDEGVGMSISSRKSPNDLQNELMINGGSPVCRSESTPQQDIGASLLTLVTNAHRRLLVSDIS